MTNTNKLNGTTAESSSAVGDAAKLREAVIEARRFVFAAMQGQRDLLVNDKISEPYVIKAKDTLAKIDAALAAPARNCDVGTADEQSFRFRDVWERANGERAPQVGVHLASQFSRWSQMPYEEGGAK